MEDDLRLTFTTESGYIYLYLLSCELCSYVCMYACMCMCVCVCACVHVHDKLCAKRQFFSPEVHVISAIIKCANRKSICSDFAYIVTDLFVNTIVPIQT